MKSRFSVVLVLALSLFLCVTMAYAGYEGEAGEAYTSWCEAWYGDLVDQGPHYAYQPGPSPNAESGYAEARANGWDIGASAHGVLGAPDGDSSFYIEGNASFSQLFRITEAGPASITFSWDGWMSIIPGEGTPSGGWDGIADGSVNFSIETSDDLEQNYYSRGGSGSLGQFISTDYDTDFTFNYDFPEEMVGEFFNVDAYLETWVTGGIYQDESGNPMYAGQIWLDSNFLDSLKISEVTGGIAPVPIPGAVWLLGSGLIGLVAVRRRRKPHSPE